MPIELYLPKTEGDFGALKVISSATADLRARAAQGVHRVQPTHKPGSSPYLTACAMTLPQLGARVMFSYDNYAGVFSWAMPIVQLEQVRHSAHFSMSPIPNELKKQLHRENGIRAIHDFSRLQLRLWLSTLFGRQLSNVWCEQTYLQPEGFESLHGRLFVVRGKGGWVPADNNAAVERLVLPGLERPWKLAPEFFATLGV